jgi:hypothetical protein
MFNKCTCNIYRCVHYDLLLSSTVFQISLRRVFLPLTGISVLQVKFKTVMPDPTPHGFVFWSFWLYLEPSSHTVFKRSRLYKRMHTP